MTTYLDDVADAIRANLPTGTEVPEDSDSLFVLYAVLLRVKGAEVSEEDVHDAWVAWMLSRGDTHKAMVPFSELDQGVRAEDAPFAEAIRRAARLLRS